MPDPDPVGSVAEFVELRWRFERLLEEVEQRGGAWTPAIDVVRDDGNLVLKADVPGIEAEEIAIEVDEGVYVVSGKHEEAAGRPASTTCAASARYGAFSVCSPLPEGVDPRR